MLCFDLFISCCSLVVHTLGVTPHVSSRTLFLYRHTNSTPHLIHYSLISSGTSSTPDSKRGTVNFAQAPDPVQKDDLHTDGIEKLTVLGVLSNWLNWSFLMETSISASIYDYIMQGPIPASPPSYYEASTANICSTIARYVSDTNLVTIWRHKGDPFFFLKL